MPATAWPLYPLLLSVLLSISLAAELGVLFLLKRSLLALPFLLAALPLLFNQPGPVVLQISLGALPLTLTQGGLERFISIVLKSTLSVQAAVLLSAVTPLPHILIALRRLHIPRLLVVVIGLMWRYLFLMVDEVARLGRARASRSGSLPGHRSGGQISWRGKVAGEMVGGLLLRSFERSDRVYAAMLARGYDGEVRTFPLPPLPRRQKILLAGGIILCVCIVLIGLLIG